MNESSNRIIKPDNPPSDSEVAKWMGKDACTYWKKVTQLIEKFYPNVFTPEWLFGGKKHGWSLRYKKSKSFCTLIPEKNQFLLQIVFGEKERENVEAIKKGLSQKTRKEYDKATIYHDGKWLLLKIDTEKMVDDVIRLLAVKRRPKKTNEA
jgi:hypothetical protein